jgi:uncharacterized protein
MSQDVQLALKLQLMDRQLMELEREIRGLPKKIAAMETALETHQRHINAEMAALAAHQKEMRRVDNITQDHRNKLEKLKRQIMQATTQEQLTAFQHEIDWCTNEIAKNEALAADLLAGEETLKLKVAANEASLAGEKTTLDTRKQQAAEQSEIDRKKGIRVYRERQLLAKEVPAPLMQTYERLRKKHKDGVIVGECTDGLCTACQMTIRPALMQQIRQAPDKMFFCESCGRILFYNPPRSIEGTASSQSLSS